MKARCPNDPTHQQFVTVASVMEEWLVDENGNYISTISSLQTNNGPNPGNVWTCFTCGAEAKVASQ